MKKLTLLVLAATCLTLLLTANVFPAPPTHGTALAKPYQPTPITRAPIAPVGQLTRLETFPSTDPNSVMAAANNAFNNLNAMIKKFQCVSKWVGIDISYGLIAHYYSPEPRERFSGAYSSALKCAVDPASIDTVQKASPAWVLDCMNIGCNMMWYVPESGDIYVGVVNMPDAGSQQIQDDAITKQRSNIIHEIDAR